MATFGSILVPNADSNVNDKVTGSQFTCTEAGTADSLWFSAETFGNNRAAKGVIYKASDNSLVGTTNEVTRIWVGGDFIELTFPAVKPSLTAQDYILCGWSGTNVFIGTKAAGGSNILKDDEVYNGAPATFADDVEAADKEVCIYCSYTPAGGVSVPVMMNHYGTHISKKIKGG